jgi:hypothetical protein
MLAFFTLERRFPYADCDSCALLSHGGMFLKSRLFEVEFPLALLPRLTPWGSRGPLDGTLLAWLRSKGLSVGSS